MADQHVGVVKSYGSWKGFGFITSDEIPGEEIYFSKKSLPQELLGALGENCSFQLKGKSVSFALTQSDAGKLQAGEVCLVAQEGDELVGKVKSYNGQKGFGFLTCSAVQGQDIFFQKRDLPGQFQGYDLQNGTAKFTLAFAPDGKPQAKGVQPQGMMGGPSWMKGTGFGGGSPMMALMPMNGGKGTSWGCGWGGGWGGKGGCWSGGSGGVPDRDRAMQGVVKSYHEGRGFGFINAPEVPADIYFKGNGESFSSGMAVAFYLTFAQDGKPQAQGVVQGLSEGETSTGTVKSYNKIKGFGFIQVPGHPGDVYFKKDFLPENLEGDITGRTAQFIVHIAQDGKAQVQQLEFVDSPIQKQAITPGANKRPRAALAGTGAGPQAKRAKVDTGNELEGTVKSYNLKNGWGFIRTDNMDADIYFKGNYPNASRGQIVRFTLAYAADGKPQAQDLQL